MDKIENSSTPLKDYLHDMAKQNNLTFQEAVENKTYRLISKADQRYEIKISTCLPPTRLAICNLEFGDVSFVDADDRTFRLIVDKLVKGDYKVYDTPVNKYFKHLFFFIDSNNKRFEFYNDDGSEIRSFDYRVTNDSFPPSYYKRWPGIN